MVYLFVLLSLIIGFWFSSSWITFIPLTIVYSIFLIYRFGLKKFLIVIPFIPLGLCLSFINITTNRSTLKGIVYEVKDNYFLFQSRFERLYVYEKNNEREIGDILFLTGKRGALEFEVLESSFDFNDYLKKNGVVNRFYPTSIEAVFNNPLRINKTKKEILNSINDQLTKETIKSLLYGSISKGDINDSLDELHLTRLISSSGLYFSLLLGLLNKLWSKKFSKTKSYIISFSCLLPLAVFLFPKLSIIKITISFFLFLLSECFLKKRLDYISRHSLSLLILLFFDYHLVYKTSFILLTFVPLFSYICNCSFLYLKKHEKRIFIPFLIYIFFIPFEASFYNSISPFSFLYQLLLLPLLVPFVALSTLTIIKIPILNILSGYSNFLSSILGFLKKTSFSVSFPSFSPILTFTYYFLFALILYFLSIRYKPLIKKNVLLFSIFLLANIVPFSNFSSKEVSFINVGQGDSILIRNGLKTALIDTGGSLYSDIAKDVLIPYFRKKRITAIDYVIITHDDYDHCGAFESLKTNFKVKREIRNPSQFPIMLKDIKIDNINTYVDMMEEDNDRSLVLNFSVDGMRFLCTGDASTTIERKLLEDQKDIRCDILKLGHHGSSTSSSNNFLKITNAKEAVISVGKNNKYGHPSDKILTLLYQNKIKIRRTDIEGTITYFFN